MIAPVSYNPFEQLPLTPIELTQVLDSFVEKFIPKKTSLLTAGNVATEAHFVIEGCIRVFYEHKDHDISAYFFTEGMFTGACESFIGQKPSRHFIETVEDCRVLSVTYTDLQELYVRFPIVNTFFRELMEKRFEAIHNLFTAQILDSPEERYLNLLSTNPKLLQRLPQHQIATYLGITPVSLSRIRQRIKK